FFAPSSSTPRSCSWMSRRPRSIRLQSGRSRASSGIGSTRTRKAEPSYGSATTRNRHDASARAALRCNPVASDRRDDIMENPYLQLSYSQVGLSAMLILINGAISVLLKLGLERRLLLAAFATVAQLVLIGFLLDWVFRLNRWYVVLALMVAMTLISGTAA